MKIVWLDQADQDLSKAVERNLERNPEAAKRIAGLICLQVKQLQKYPQLGRVGQIESTRELAINQTHYVAAYRIDFSNNLIEILALMHESMQWPEEF